MLRVPPASRRNRWYWSANRRTTGVAGAGVACATYYTTPLHLQPALAFLGHKPGDFPATEEAAATNLALPMHPHLTQEQVAEVAHALAGVSA